MKYALIAITALSMTACSSLPKPVDSQPEQITVPPDKKVIITIVIE